MMYKALKSKIHRARVTKAKVDYPGSVGVDSELMEAAGLLPYEEVLLANVTNGARLETYVIPEKPGSGDVVILGAAAKVFNTNDIVIMMNFGYYTPQEMKELKPKVVIVDEMNKIKEIL
jgi:aspartate 1-decarboxylase